MGIIYLTTNKINNKKYIGVDSKNNKYYFGSGKSIRLALKKYGTKNFTKEIIEESSDIDYLFQREKYYIEKYDAINSKEFYNMAEGGKGGNGTLITEESKEKHRKGLSKIVKITIEKRKNKTYEEIYGERAHEEKEKRRLAGLGKKYSEERIKKSSDARKGLTPWNKGKKGCQVAWNKGKKGYGIKTYILYNNDEKIKFNNRNELENYIKTINKDKKRNSKININNLINNKEEKGYNLEIICSKNKSSIN